MKARFSHKVLSLILALCLIMMSLPAMFVVGASAADVESDLVGYWTFDEANGTTVEIRPAAIMTLYFPVRVSPFRQTARLWAECCI